LDKRSINLSLVFLLTFFFLGFIPTSSRASEQIEKQTNGVILELPEGFLNIQFFSDSIVHVAFAKDRKFFSRKTIDVVGQPLPQVAFTLEPTLQGWHLKGKQLIVSIDRSNGNVQFLNSNGFPILAEDSRQLEPAQVQGEKTFHIHQQWKGISNESLYGLGQNQFGMLDLKGYDLDLWQHNTNAVIPFLVSSNGYGILWDNTSFTRFGDLRDFVPIPSEYLLSKNHVGGGLTVSPLGKSKPISQSSDLNIAFKPTKEARNAPSRVREGFLKAPENGDYQLDCYSNGGIKVWLDGRLIMNHWRQNWLSDHDRAKVKMAAGKSYPFKIEWNTEQGTTFRFTWKTPSSSSNTSLWSEVGDGTDYYFVYGPELDKVLAGYRSLTGQAPLMPSWAFGLWQSRQRYETAQQSLDVVDGFRKRRIPFDNIVQDWRYWSDGTWGSHQFDSARFPDPDVWLKALHEKHAHVMISVWSKFYTGTDNFKAMNEKGYLFQPNLKEGLKDWLDFPYTFYDPFNPGARELFWNQINEDLFQKGIDAWWLDSTEPDLTPSPPDLEALKSHMNPTAMGTGSRMLLGYPLMNSKAVYEGQRKASPNQRVFILTRSAFSGEQRNAAAIWSGDITSTWAVFAKQIPAGLNFSLSGMPYWSTDIGGYTMQKKFSTKNPKPEDEKEWRELNTRWFEFGTFCPLLRVHGELRPREMWELGGESSPAYKAELKFDRLRYRMFPYLYSLAANTTNQGGTFMRPLVMDFPQDETARELTDEYMFGPAFLVAPITQYKARNRKVYLPKEATWYDFWTGKTIAGGAQKDSAPYDSIPLFVRAGSIVPFGPELQYIAEKPQDPTTLYVYAGANGDFNLYEDDGLTYDYEKGAFSEIPIHWDDTVKTLTLGTREGSFKGMLKKRIFQLVLVSRKHPIGFSFEPRQTRSVNYDGSMTTLALEDSP
jgi:alpha-D-xyloside xylohydrolase